MRRATKGPFYLTGSEDFKRKTWLVSAMMGLEVSNYQPTQSDLSALFERVKANQDKYPKTKIKLLERHINELKKENFEIDDLFKTSVSFSDLFPNHSASENIEAPETEKPEKPEKEKPATSTGTKTKSKAEKIFDNQETDRKLLEKLTRQGEMGLDPLQPLKVHKP